MDVQQEVEAALLNSGGAPEKEIAAALLAVAKFAYTECDATETQFIAMVRVQWSIMMSEQGDHG